ncbi:hybrid non-ribosomal peptide synthetase/type I polyketide synthase [Opitutus sp. GAS368]|uniref:hybrid non-ribosomal peptide synthetase/type I polyketide synthase n=1 Tax=Opitutus sp. GAS368 TaxID=1882749 RepID=UPI00087C3703|nr:hybrid non-ribosomal peptide synthetase/type I polyketide synthase [Opitutus sp. GAS368]SDS42428.1 amino acid adenylation domain-containing protein [Opitutus sp. GAS368]
MSQPDQNHEDIAVIGLAGRFPGARDPGEFWRNLRDGVESVAFFTAGELQPSPLDGPLPKDDPHVVRARALLAQPEWFDAAFFGVNPREAELMDPQHRLLLECAWEALENAGVNPDTCPGSIGVFAGASLNTYLLANVLPQAAALRRAGGFQALLASDKDFLTTRISYKLNLRGPSLNVQTACSTSLVAVSLACQNLLGYHCDLALAGGVSVSFPQKKGLRHQEGGIVSPDGHCRPFDADAAGTVPGDGAGLVLLKRLSEALADGDSVHAIIRGCAINNDGALKIGYTAPSIDGQAEVIAQAQAQAGVEPETISYIETHGTGTPLGDPIEVAGLTKAFAKTRATGFCALGAAKANIGHLDTAAGIAGFIKTVLALEHRQLPPVLHYRRPNPKIDFAGGPFYVNDRLRDWPANGTPRRAGVSSFGIGGTNAHVVLEEAPAVPPSDPAGPWQLLVLSARTATALDAATANLAQHLETHPDLNLADVAWTLQAGRKPFAHRRALVCRDAGDAIGALRGADPKHLLTGEPAGAEAPVVFLFPGQGAQHVDMARGLYEAEPLFRETVDRCCEILQPHLGLDLRAVLYPAAARRDEAARQLGQTGFTQPALFVIEYALARLWMSRGIRPAAMLGHSLGEYVAACLAGVFTLEDALALVAARARLVQQQPAGAMLAVRLPEAGVTGLISPPLALAAVNAPNLCVVSGPIGAIAALETRLGEGGTACRRLATSHAFHSEMMEPVRDAFLAEVRKVKLSPPQLPYVSNVTGRWITAAEATDPAYWAGHLRQPVRYADGIGTLFREQRPVLLEVGPGQTLGPLARQHPAAGAGPGIVCSLGRTNEGPGDVPAFLQALARLWLAGVAPEWSGLHAPARRRRVPLPTYPFERQRFWIEPPAATANDLVPPPAGDDDAEEAAAPAPRPAAADTAGSTLLARLRALFHELSGTELAGDRGRASFHELGFDSLFLTQVSLAVQDKFGVEVTMRQLLEQFPSLEKLAAHLEQLHPAPAGQSNAPLPLAATEPATTVPLTDAQSEIWFAAQLGAGVSAAYNESCTLHLHGLLDVPALRCAVQQLVDRHEALRTTFDAAGDGQHIAADGRAELPVADLSAADPAATTEMRLARFIDDLVPEPFDLVRGPLWRMRLAQLAEDHHALVLVAHHIICDGWSMHLLVYELGELYTALRRGEAAKLPPPARFSAYARHQAERQQAPAFAAAETYWLGQFAGPVPVLDLPADRPRPATRTYAGAHQGRALPPAITAGVRQLAAEHGCTIFTVLLSVFTTLLHRLSGQDDLVVGVPAAAQVLGGRRNLVGHCANLLPIRSRLDDGQTGGDFLAATRHRVLDAFEHWQHPFGGLLRKLNLPRDPNRVPLANVTFNLGRLHGVLRFGELDAKIAINPKSFVNFDLNFNVTEADGALTFDCHYSTELFDRDTIARLLERYEFLLGSAAANLPHAVHRGPLLLPAELRAVTAGWNRTAADYPRDLCLHEMFAEQARRTPGATALVHGEERWTYRDLNERANQVAHHLRRLGVNPDTPVGICTARTPAMVAGVLGILKAGGAYVPLDPAYPAERLAFMLEDAGAKVLLTQGAPRFPVPRSLPPGALLRLDADWPEKFAPERTTDPVADARAGHLAYVIYTSGSTGRPKGVAIEHRSAVAFVHWAHGTFTPGELRGVLAATSLSFDLSVFELFVPLTCGGTVILADNALQLPALPARDEVTLVNTVPSAITELLRTGDLPASVRTVNLAGEPLAAPLVAQLYARPAVQKVHDLYGPTETTTYSTCALRLPDGPATIGRPIANTQVYLLDRHQQLVPPGTPGELWIGGAGLARGYLNRPELTAEKFPTLAVGDTPPARLYRTGDLARHRPDGSLEYLGRLDHQVKIRGYRIELGEVTAVLARHPAVHECVVIVREDTPGDRRLVAYLTPRPGANPDGPALRAALASALPDHMVPSAFVRLDRLPHTPNGKIDRRALPAPGHDRSEVETTYAAPRSTTEEVLAGIWCTVLGLKQVGVHDNFFDLGGHSLLVTQVLARVRQAFHVGLSLRRAFESPTVAQLAAAVEAALVEEIQTLSDEEAARLVAHAALPPAD